MQYHDTLACKFDSMNQILDLYDKVFCSFLMCRSGQEGDVDEQFFVDVGMEKLGVVSTLIRRLLRGHRRLVQKWFKERKKRR